MNRTITLIASPAIYGDAGHVGVTVSVFVDCLTVVERLLSCSFSVQEAAPQTLSSLEQAVSFFQETKLVSSVLGKTLPVHVAPVRAGAQVDLSCWTFGKFSRPPKGGFTLPLRQKSAVQCDFLPVSTPAISASDMALLSDKDSRHKAALCASIPENIMME